MKFEFSSLIDAPVEVVWQFHERPDVLQLLTPPWQPVEVVRREGGLAVGAIAEFRIHLGPVPVRWLARQVECELYRRWCDRAIEGPLPSWLHCHQLSEQAGKTRLTDTINYELPGGEVSDRLLGWWINSRLKEMFRYRHEVTRQECELDKREWGNRK